MGRARAQTPYRGLQNEVRWQRTLFRLSTVFYFDYKSNDKGLLLVLLIYVINLYRSY